MAIRVGIGQSIVLRPETYPPGSQCPSCDCCKLITSLIKDFCTSDGKQFCVKVV